MVYSIGVMYAVETGQYYGKTVTDNKLQPSVIVVCPVKLVSAIRLVSSVMFE